MVSYILRRILSTIPVMAIVALFVFSLLYIAPGDPAVVIAGDQASPADVERIRQSLGLDRPFLVQFGSWLWHILHGDLGTSIFTSLSVSSMIAQRIEPTLSLMMITLILTILIAVPLGVVAAVGRMALTNYLLQTLICTTIFYGHGLGLFGSVDRAGQFAIVLAVWAFELLASSAWLRYFAVGPVEWLLRWVVHGRRPSFLHSSPAPVRV